MLNINKVEKEIGGRMLSIETGRVAKQADGAVLVTYGETVVLVSAVTAAPRSEEIDFFPLSVDYREKQSAAGKFPGGFIKREGRPSTKEILTARMIDRPIRPLFPEGYFQEVQIMVNVLSADNENDPDIRSKR
jgi:polyribonucleotide nucleotidyltransferase